MPYGSHFDKHSQCDETRNRPGAILERFFLFDRSVFFRILVRNVPENVPEL
jgi:hypothetical protein